MHAALEPELHQTMPGLRSGNGIEESLERPALLDAFCYWQSLRADRPAPAIHELDPLDIVPVLPFVNLVDVYRPTDGGYRFRHRLLGTALVGKFQAESTGQWFDELYTPEHLARQLPAYIMAVEDVVPTLGDIGLDSEGRQIMAYRRLILPLAGPSGSIDRLMAVFAFQTPDDRFVEGLPLHQVGRGSNFHKD
ncbi:MAG: PAS domain-containing protein [Alphaproteobacteria bacterium]